MSLADPMMRQESAEYLSDASSVESIGKSRRKQRQGVIPRTLFGLFLLAVLVGVSRKNSATVGSRFFREHRQPPVEPESPAVERPRFKAASAALTAVGSSALSHIPNVGKPLLIEVGALVLLQSVGLPLISKALMTVRRLRILRTPSNFTTVSGVLWKGTRVFLRHGSRVWRRLGVAYKNTSATKIVGRSKRIVKIFRHEDEHH